MNRHYGNATLGEQAYEVQRYVSNTNITVTHLRSMQEIDYVNVRDGASNGSVFLRGSIEWNQDRRLSYSRARILQNATRLP